MSAPPNPDAIREFRGALPPRAVAQMHDTQAIAALVYRAVGEQGWTVPELAAECSRNLAGIENAGGLVTYRLRHCAEHPPAAPVRHQRVHYGCCADGWLYPDLHDVKTVTKCPGNTTGASR